MSAPDGSPRHHVGHQALVARACLHARAPRSVAPRDVRPAPLRSRPARSGSPGSSPGHRSGPETRGRRWPGTAPDPPCDTSVRPAPPRTGPAQTSPSSVRDDSSSRAPARRHRCRVRRRHRSAPAADSGPARRSRVFAIGRPIGIVRAPGTTVSTRCHVANVVHSVGP